MLVLNLVLGMKKQKVVKPNPNAKMADINLRKAMWHAVDNNTVGESSIMAYVGLQQH